MGKKAQHVRCMVSKMRRILYCMLLLRAPPPPPLKGTLHHSHSSDNEISEMHRPRPDCAVCGLDGTVCGVDCAGKLHRAGGEGDMLVVSEAGEVYVEMSKFQSINRHNVLATIEINGVQLGRVIQDLAWTDIRLRLLDRVVPDKESYRYAPQSNQLPGGCAAKGAHVAPE